MSQIIFNSILKGLLGASLLLTLYFTIVTLISGWSFTLDQFSKFWYFLTALTIGFGIQVGMYSYLKSSVKKNVSRGLVATSGATSTVAMVSCCAHYLANVLPILGITGVITLISQYQVRFFWVGLVFNLLGISYIWGKIYQTPAYK